MSKGTKPRRSPKAFGEFGLFAAVQATYITADDYLSLRGITTTERDALTATNGMLIYNSTLEKFQGYENGTWTNLI